MEENTAEQKSGTMPEGTATASNGSAASGEEGSRLCRVVVADDQPLMLRAMSEIVEEAEGFTVVGRAENGEEAVRLVREHSADLLLTDLDMPTMTGTEAIGAVAEEGLCRSLALTTFSGLEWVVGALRAGASGYLLKDASPRTVVDSLRKVLDDETVLAPPVMRMLVDQVAEMPATPRPQAATPEDAPHVTEREQQVLDLLAGGLSNKEIAEELYLSPSAVKLHIGKACDRLGARDRVQLLVRAVEYGLVTPALLRPETAQDRYR